jgi:hypothetical protein
VVGAGARLNDVVIGDNERVTAGTVLDGVRVPEPR